MSEDPIIDVTHEYAPAMRATHQDALLEAGIRSSPREACGLLVVKLLLTEEGAVCPESPHHIAVRQLRNLAPGNAMFKIELSDFRPALEDLGEFINRQSATDQEGRAVPSKVLWALWHTHPKTGEPSLSEEDREVLIHNSSVTQIDSLIMGIPSGKWRAFRCLN